MNGTLLATRVLLAVVFFAAGLAKLFDLKGSQKAITDFGLPPPAAKPLGIGLPIVEIIIVLLLLPVRSAWIGAMGALALLLAFITAIAVNVGLGRRPKCHCFGQVHSETVGWSTLVRNGVLAFLAAVLVWQARTNPGLSVQSVIRDVSTVQLLTGMCCLLTLIALGTLSWLVLHLFRQNGRLLLRIEALEANRPLNQKQLGVQSALPGLPIGTKAISFDLPKMGGGRASLEGFLREDKPLLLISTDPNCGPCNALMPDIAMWQKGLATELTVVLLSHGRFSENQVKATEYGLVNVVVERDSKVAEQYQAVGTPTAILIRKDGTIGSPAVGGADRIRQLIADKAWTDTGYVAFMTSVAQPPQAAPPKPMLVPGSVAPAFTLPDLRGKVVNSVHFNGNGTMLLFWNPACGFCQRMLPELKKWQSRRRHSSPAKSYRLGPHVKPWPVGHWTEPCRVRTLCSQRARLEESGRPEPLVHSYAGHDPFSSKGGSQPASVSETGCPQSQVRS